MLSILSTLVPVFGIILFGIVVERMGFLPIETSGCLNQFVYWIGLPMMLFNQLARMEAGQMSGAMVGGILLGYGITYLFAYVVFSSLLRRRWEESSVFALLSSFPNAAFMGLPIVVLLLPDSSEAAIVASLCAVMTSANLLFTDGRLEAGKHKGEGRKQVFLSLLRSLFHNPLLIYSALGAAVSLLHIAVPKPILSMSAMLGSTSAPCALFCMGMILSKQMTSSQGFVKGWARRQFPLHVLKLVVEPLFIFGVLYLLGVRGIALASATIVAAMPTAVAAYIIAEKYQVATEDSSLGIVVDTALSAGEHPSAHRGVPILRSAVGGRGVAAGAAKHPPLAGAAYGPHLHRDGADHPARHCGYGHAQPVLGQHRGRRGRGRAAFEHDLPRL